MLIRSTASLALVLEYPAWLQHFADTFTLQSKMDKDHYRGAKANGAITEECQNVTSTKKDCSSARGTAVSSHAHGQDARQKLQQLACFARLMQENRLPLSSSARASNEQDERCPAHAAIAPHTPHSEDIRSSASRKSTGKTLHMQQLSCPARPLKQKLPWPIRFHDARR